MNGSISNEMATLAWAGLIIVFAVLALIAGLVGLFKRLDDRWQAREARADAAAGGRAQNIDDITLVLIAAACATTIGGRFRVRRIRRLLSPRTKRTPWSAQGRLILQGSHSVDRKRDQR